MDDYWLEAFRADKKPCRGDEIPYTLFHYTNLDVLALILKNKTLRLTRLDFLDDLEEKNCRSLPNVKVYTYVSCWTKDARESIPMWNMYTDMQNGIRIEMPALPFKNKDKLEHFFGNYDTTTGKWKKEENVDMMNLGKYIIFSPDHLNETLYEVKYTDNPLLLSPEISFEISHNVQGVDPYKMGIYKRKNWDFQNEYRYVIHLEGKNGFLPNPYYDLELSDEALKQIKIVTSPKFTDGNDILLKSLLKEFSIDTAPSQSELYKMIK